MYYRNRPKRAKLGRKGRRLRRENELTVLSTGWFDLLPFEMRAMIIDKMDFKTKCLFARCSKMCAEEVKASKGFKLHISLCESQIFIGHDHDEDSYLYYLKFVEKRSCDGPKTEVIYFKSRKLKEGIEKWKRLESGDAEEVQMRYFDDYVDDYHKNIFKIEIEKRPGETEFPAWRYDMRKLINIKFIEDHTSVDLLKSAVFNLSQIAYADDVSSRETNVTFEQLISLKGQCYYLQAKCIKDQHISRYLKMLKKGEIGANLKFLKLQLGMYSLPNISEITEGLDVRHVNAEEDEDDWVTRRPMSMFVFASDDSNIGYCECLFTQCYMKITTGIDEHRLAEMRDV